MCCVANLDAREPFVAMCNGADGLAMIAGETRALVELGVQIVHTGGRLLHDGRGHLGDVIRFVNSIVIVNSIVNSIVIVDGGGRRGDFHLDVVHLDLVLVGHRRDIYRRNRVGGAQAARSSNTAEADDSSGDERGDTSAS